MSNEKFTPTETIVAQLAHNDRERELCAELVSRINYHAERRTWWQNNAEAIAKERADAWTALLAVEPFMREDMPDGPDGERGCASPHYRNAFRLVLARGNWSSSTTTTSSAIQRSAFYFWRMIVRPVALLMAGSN